MDAFQEIENLGNSWIINHHNNYILNNNYNGNDDFIKILLSVINLAYFDNNLNMKFNFQINDTNSFNFYIESLNYAFSTLHNIKTNYINNNNNIKTFIFLWNNLIHNNNNDNNTIIKQNILKFINSNEINSKLETLEISNLMNILNINFNNYEIKDYNKIYEYIKIFKTKMIKDASIINREIFNKFKKYNNWIDNSNVNIKYYASHNKYDFKHTIKYKETYKIKNISWSKAKKFFINGKFNKIYYNNIKIKFNNFKNISNILGFKRNTIIKWKRNNFINDIFDIKYYIDKEWKNQYYNYNLSSINSNTRYNIKDTNKLNYIQYIKKEFNLDLINNSNLNKNNNIDNKIHDNTPKIGNFHEKLSYRANSPD